MTDSKETKLRLSSELVGLALELGAGLIDGWSIAETELASNAVSPSSNQLAAAESAISFGSVDPLGEWYCQIYSKKDRRPRGAIYTPPTIIDIMVSQAARLVAPARVVDPGAGSSRFLVAAGKQFPNAELIAVELDPLASILSRGHLAAAGFAHRARVLQIDYRDMQLPEVDGPTLFLGNPPYVRHHHIETQWKQWFSRTAETFGFNASRLAGLHAYFFLATAELGKQGDCGVLITAAEWLDVNYGRLVRDLLLGPLGVRSIHVTEPTVAAFPGIQTTSVITGFEIGSSSPTITVGHLNPVDALKPQDSEWSIPRERLMELGKWSLLTRSSEQKREGFIELGELCKVHRGQATGANRIWIDNGNPFDLPQKYLFATVTRARELFASNGILSDPSHLRRVIDLPADLDILETADRIRIEDFLLFARSKGVDKGYLARRRKSWWFVGLKDPAPILASYMARRPPTFVRNLANVRHINVAHGLYPIIELSEDQLTTLSEYLSRSVQIGHGRTYAGGLTKFEPKDMERLLIPCPEMLATPGALP